MALERLGAYAETATLRAAAANSDEPSPAAVSSTSSGGTPPTIATKTTTGSAAARQFVLRTRPVTIMPSTISAVDSRVASSESRLLQSRSRAIDCEPASAIAISARLATITPKVERPNKAAPTTELRSQPARSQNKMQPATTAAATITDAIRSRNAVPRRTEEEPHAGETDRVACAGPCGILGHPS